MIHIKRLMSLKLSLKVVRTVPGLTLLTVTFVFFNLLFMQNICII